MAEEPWKYCATGFATGDVFDLQLPWRQGDVCVDRRPPAGLDGKWKEWLGEIATREVRAANVWFYTRGVTTEPGILGREDQDIAKRQECFWRAFLLQGLPEIIGVVRLGGTVGREEGLAIRSFDRIEPVRRIFNGWAPRIDADLLGRARLCGETMARAYREERVGGRLSRGYYALDRSLRSRYIEHAVSNAVRSLDALFHPNQGKQFVKRAALVFESETLDVAELFESIWKLRSKLEHMEPMRLGVGGDPATAEPRGLALGAGIQQLALRAYAAIFSSSELIDLFATDQLGEVWGAVASGREPPPFRIRIDPRWLTEDKQEPWWLEEVLDGRRSPFEPLDW